MNFKEHKTLLEMREKEDGVDIFQATRWAMEYVPLGLNFILHYRYDQLDLVAKGYEVEGFSFLKMAIRGWKAGLSKINYGLSSSDKKSIESGIQLIENTTRMLCYSHGDFSIDNDRLINQNDELAVYYALSSLYSYWIYSTFK